ncbi:MAG: 4-hydroxy-4-methyl-2-oxoglutarate aldolase [Rhodospirillales bacterium 69-11]|nr:RraA family protein [Rhodospirillales bacterium]OJW28704.1 MAG: 4-hydroxy-4-methyl-2-oxoglutarate aldolase [Rhodospirillales bacterium 69-11]
MFVLKDLPPQIDPALLEKLREAEPATIGHFRHVGFMDPGIRALLPGYRRIVGTAVTVRAYGADTAIVHYALGKLRPGDVLVLDRAGDTRHAACGGGVAFAAKAAGCVGIIIDGPATDIQELREYDMPVWARGLSVVTGKRQFEHGEFCTAVSCGGVAVEPGDAVLADENGVLVMKPHEVADAAARAVAMQTHEKEKTIPRLRAGEKMPEINDTNARIAEIMRASKS